MRFLKNIILLFSIIIVSCSEQRNHDEKINATICPCDSIGDFSLKGKQVKYAYIGNTMIEITKMNPIGDTVVVIRHCKIDNKYKMQEVLGLIKGKINNNGKSFYCDFKEEPNDYKLTFIRDESKNESLGLPIVTKLIGVDAVVGKDTFFSKSLSVTIPKNKFNGIILLNKKMIAKYLGQTDIYTGQIYLDADVMKNHGSLLTQYKMVLKDCIN